MFLTFSISSQNLKSVPYPLGQGASRQTCSVTHNDSSHIFSHSYEKPLTGGCGGFMLSPQLNQLLCRHRGRVVGVAGAAKGHQNKNKYWGKWPVDTEMCWEIKFHSLFWQWRSKQSLKVIKTWCQLKVLFVSKVKITWPQLSRSILIGIRLLDWIKS